MADTHTITVTVKGEKDTITERLMYFLQDLTGRECVVEGFAVGEPPAVGWNVKASKVSDR